VNLLGHVRCDALARFCEWLLPTGEGWQLQLLSKELCKALSSQDIMSCSHVACAHNLQEFQSVSIATSAMDDWLHPTLYKAGLDDFSFDFAQPLSTSKLSDWSCGVCLVRNFARYTSQALAAESVLDRAQLSRPAPKFCFQAVAFKLFQTVCCCRREHCIKCRAPREESARPICSSQTLCIRNLGEQMTYVPRAAGVVQGGTAAHV
jgi:hypothetical protein